MKKLQNDKKRLVDEAMAGYAAAHRDVLEHIAGTRMMARRHPKEPGKVRLMMGNGGGHEPAVIGWVGQGMLDLNVVGDVFTAPSGKMIYQGISRLAETGPVILFVQNHAGDVMNQVLGIAVIRQAADDYRAIARRLNTIGSSEEKHRLEQEMVSLRRFFQGAWYEVLSDSSNGSLILERLDREVYGND